MPTTDGYGERRPVSGNERRPEHRAGVPGCGKNALTKQTVLRFANANERSATLMGAFAAVPGMLSYLIAEDRWDQFDGDGVWRPLTPGAWKPITFASGYTAFGGSPGYRIVNGCVEMRGAFQRTTVPPSQRTRAKSRRLAPNGDRARNRKVVYRRRHVQRRLFCATG
ncbi:hypothetical protein SMICM304S_11404 [Streptomyces microflavus]